MQELDRPVGEAAQLSDCGQPLLGPGLSSIRIRAEHDGGERAFFAGTIFAGKCALLHQEVGWRRRRRRHTSRHCRQCEGSFGVVPRRGRQVLRPSPTRGHWNGPQQISSCAAGPLRRRRRRWHSPTRPCSEEQELHEHAALVGQSPQRRCHSQRDTQVHWWGHRRRYGSGEEELLPPSS